MPPPAEYQQTQLKFIIDAKKLELDVRRKTRNSAFFGDALKTIEMILLAQVRRQGSAWSIQDIKRTAASIVYNLLAVASATTSASGSTGIYNSPPERWRLISKTPRSRWPNSKALAASTPEQNCSQQTQSQCAPTSTRIMLYLIGIGSVGDVAIQESSRLTMSDIDSVLNWLDTMTAAREMGIGGLSLLYDSSPDHAI